MEANDRELIRRMLDTSRSYRAAYEVLTSKLPSFGPAEPVMATLAFEVALKAVSRTSLLKAPNFRHDYREGFESLPSEIKTEVLIQANQVEAGLNLTEGGFLTICKDLEKVFLRYRYDYESYENAEKEEKGGFAKKGKAWLDGGQLEEADFRFHPDKTRAVTLALQFVLQEWLEASSQK